MCEPVTIGLAISAATAAYGVYATRQNAKKQERVTRQAQTAREDQLFDEKSQQANARLRQARAEKARLRALAADSGLSGMSIDDLLTNQDFQAGMDMAQIQQNSRHALTANRIAGQSALNSIEQPDYLGAALSVAGNGLQIYNNSAADQQGRFRDYWSG